MTASKKNETTETTTSNPAIAAAPEAGVNDAVEQLEETDQQLLNRLLGAVEAQTVAATEMLVNQQEANDRIASKDLVIGFGAGALTATAIIGGIGYLGKRKAAKEAALFGGLEAVNHLSIDGETGEGTFSNRD